MQTLKSLSYILGMLALAAYMLNPGAGVFELIPDNIPFVGNLDEVAAVGLFVTLWRKWRALRQSAVQQET